MTPSPLAKSVRDVLDWICRTTPLEATQLGIHDQDHRVDRIGPARESDELLDILRNIPGESRAASDPAGVGDAGTWGRGAADPDDAIDAAALRAHLAEILIVSYELDLPVRSTGYMIDEFLNAIFHQVHGSYAPARDRFRSLLYRLREVQRMLGQALLALRHSAAAGVVPSVWTAHGMEVARDGAKYLLALRGQSSRFLPRDCDAPLRRAVCEELTRASRAFQEFLKDIRRQVYPKSRRRGSAYAAGRERFGRLMADVHLLPEDPLPFVLEAEEERRTIVARLEKLSLKLAGTLNWHEADRKFSLDHPPAAGLIGCFQNEVERLCRFVKKKNLSATDSARTLKVAETPPFERAGIPYAAYQGPAPFERESREGFFFVTSPDRRLSAAARLRHLCEFPRPAICVTAAHEGVPGHHLQHLISHASRRPVRRLVWNSFFGEGWAHYAEALIFREGYTTDERSEFFMLKDQLWRCIRVSLDVDIHIRGVPLERASAELCRQAGLSAAGADSEIVRYSLEPTQPMSYFVGRRFFEDLVSAERRRQGARFDLGSFHDRLLALGAVPMPLVKRSLASK